MKYLFPVFGLLLSVIINGCRSGTGTAPDDEVNYAVRIRVETLSGVELRYAILTPDTYTENTPCPLILALHYGAGDPPPENTCQQFTHYMIRPGLSSLKGIIIAPNCPAGGGWTILNTQQAVKALVDSIQARYRIDPRRILAVGYSMGGYGTWHFIAEYPDLFTTAIPMACYPTLNARNSLPQAPVYAIQGDRDELFDIGVWEGILDDMIAGGMQIDKHIVSGASHYDTEPYVKALQSAAQWVMDLWTS